MKLRLVMIMATALSSGAVMAAPKIGSLERAMPEKIAGPVLVSELGCASCHATSQVVFAPKPGPDLSSIGARANGAHLQRFIANPSGVKPGTTMPDLLRHLPES